jgi:hypothetical protein
VSLKNETWTTDTLKELIKNMAARGALKVKKRELARS